jgi:hypothetical protein
VREAAKAHAHPMKVMLHIAQPENVLGWFDDATVAGVMDYDIIGISYYSKWSKYDLAGLGKVIAAAHKRYGADVWVVETAYPFTNDYGDTTPNLLGSDWPCPDIRHPRRSGPLYGGSDQAGRGQWRQWRGLLGARPRFDGVQDTLGRGRIGKMPHGSTSRSMRPCRSCGSWK